MKFRAAKEWGEPKHNSGFRLILTRDKVEYRLYVWWKRVDTGIYPLPIEFQRRGLPWSFPIYTWPERGRSTPKGWSPRVEDSL